ncbi:Outer membrane protein TolC [Flavobacterium fryxellicola]|uniref:Transporter n=1 Tax=Flavobacterium fryxellicola TaxID=249352 RepID=A0A167VA30_9FLAO|nr:TolC family protein [Flavobacterium fryxellicola]OAB26212.1 hypothetical protein FBFR_13315 [Flavobacterium fryxellicola]SHN79576.1 Outer membrane protein TolC [Flavobacterium fryxellicola]
MTHEKPISKSFLLVAFILCIATNSLHAQTEKKLSLEEAINLAVAHSKQLQQDSLSLKIANSKLIQSKNSLLPQVSANLSYLRISDNITPFQVALPEGNVVLNPQILNQSFNSLQVRQLLYSGGKVNNLNKILKLDQEAINFEMAKNKLELSYSITSLWYSLFSLNQSEKIIEANIVLLTNQKKDAENLVKQGVLLSNDLLKVELAITNLQSNLSEIVADQNSLRYNLRVLTGLDTSTKIIINETINQFENDAVSVETYIQKAINNRAELKLIQVREKQAKANEKLAKSNYLPLLSLGASLNYNQPEQRVFPNQPEFTGTWNVGAFLTWNLTDLYSTKNKVKESKFGLAKLKSATEQASEGISMEVNKDYNDFIQSKEKIALATKYVDQATENFRVEQNKFKTNTTTATEFLTANTLLLQAQLNLTTAKANAELAFKKLLKSTN